MAKRFFKKSFFGVGPRSKKEEAEYGAGKEDIIICSECNCVYFHKSWHHSLDEYKELSDNKNIAFKLCPADQMKKDELYEGQVLIENIPSGIQKELAELIDNIASRARERDPMDRIFSIENKGSNMEIKTSENQFALSIAKQIHSAHRNTRIDIKFSEEDIVRACVWFL